MPLNATRPSKQTIRLVLFLLLITGAVWRSRQPTKNARIETPRLKALREDPLFTHLPPWVQTTKFEQQRAYPIPRGDGGGWVDNRVGVSFDITSVEVTPEQRLTDWIRTLEGTGWTLEGRISCPPNLSIAAYKKITDGLGVAKIYERGLSLYLTGKTDLNPHQPLPFEPRTGTCPPVP